MLLERDDVQFPHLLTKITRRVCARHRPSLLFTSNAYFVS